MEALKASLTSFRKLATTPRASKPPVTPPVYESPTVHTRLLPAGYEQGETYTFTGSIVLVMNPYEALPIYGEDTMAHFLNHPLSQVAPHVFAAAEEDYQQIRRDKLQ